MNQKSDNIFDADETTPLTKTDTSGTKQRNYGFWDLLKAGTCCDKFLFGFGVVSTCLLSLTAPLTGLIYGQATSVFILHQNFTLRAQMNTLTQGMGAGSFFTDIDMVVWFFIALTTFHVVVGFTTAMLVCIPAIRIVNTLRKRFLIHIARSDKAFLETQRTGELNTMFFDHTERVLEALSTYGVGVLNTVLSAALALILAMFINWKQTACVIILMPSVGIIGVWAIRRLVQMYMQEQEVMGRSVHIIYEALRSIRTVLSFNGQKQTIDRYTKLATETKRVALKRSLFEGLAYGVEIFLNDAIGSVSFIFGAFFVTAYSDPSARGGMYTVAIELLMVTTLLYSLQVPVSSLLGAKANLRMLGKVMLTEPNIDSLSSEGGQIRKSEEDGIDLEFENINFTYESRPDVKVLKNVSFKLSRGEHLAIVGSSGAGKSTIASLILRFYDPTSGLIMANNAPLKSLNVRSWRQLIGYVSQGAPVFDGTVMENIRYGLLDATDEQVYEAAKAANVDAFVQKMPKKYDTWIGDWGLQLSGGQRQRLAIARAIIRQPQLFVFDEFTAALDSVTEQAVCEELSKLVSGKTTITIAHRLSTIRDADRIIVLAHGEIVESGSHDELMLIKDGHYARMVKVQELREFDSDDDDDGEHAGRKSDYNESTDVERAIQSYLSTDAEEGTARKRKKKEPHHPLSGKDSSLRASMHSLAAISEKSTDEKPSEQRRQASFFKIHRLIGCKTWLMLLAAVFGGFVYTLTDTASLYIFALLLKILPLPIEQMQEGIFYVAVLSVGFSAITCGSRVFFTYWHNRFGESVVYNMRVNLLTTVLKHNMSYFDKPLNSTGELSTVIIKISGKLRKAIVQDCLMMPPSLLSFVVRIGVALYINPGFAAFCMLVLPADLTLFMLSNLTMWFVQKRIEPAQNASGKAAIQTIDNLDTIQAYSLEKVFCDRYEKQLKSVERGYILQNVVSGLFESVINSTDTLYSAFIILVGASYVAEGAFSAVELWIVFFMVQNLSQTVAEVFGGSQDIVRAIMATKSALGLLEEPVELDCTADIGTTPKIEGEFKLNGIGFNYPSREDVKVLKGVTCNLRKGKTVALVGPSGSGKSTIVGLLQRLYDPTQGDITLDGTDIRAMNVRHLRTSVVPVMQDATLFDGTVLENIAYGMDSLDYTTNDVINAAKMANIYDFLRTLPEGLDSDVGEKGVQLSGGQKQRVCIARALIRNPKVLLLDEATASLDTENEKVVQVALELARKERTCLVVAHRLSTIKSADMILVMKGGRIVERGHHNSLLEKKGLYYEMCEKQKLI